MFKKIVILAVSLSLCIGFSGCAADKNNNRNQSKSIGGIEPLGDEVNFVLMKWKQRKFQTASH